MKRREFLGAATTAALLFASVGCASPASARLGRRVESDGVDETLIEAAFLYGYAVYEFSRAAFSATERGRPMNTLGHRTVLTDHTHRAVTAPNLDTLYSSAFLELSGGPMEVVTPEATDRYHSVAFMNAFTDNFAILGTRTTKGHSVRAWIAGPDWTGDVPEGVQLIRSDTNDVWMLGRTLVAGPEDLEAANRVQVQIRLEPVPGRGPVRPITTAVTAAPDAPLFIAAVNEMLGRSPSGIGQAQRASRFAAVGIRPGEADVWTTLSGLLRAAWVTRLPSLIDRLRRSAEDLMLSRNGWRASLPDVGNFGDNDALRSSTALWGLAALPADEAAYFRTSRDENGLALDGMKAYEFRLPAEGVPTDAFWSITMYSEEPDGRFFLVDNPIRRYALSNRSSGLKLEADGSLVIRMQLDEPLGDDSKNWLPTPRGPFSVSFRAYLPQPSIRDGSWAPPPIKAVSGR